MTNPEEANETLGSWKSAVSKHFTWLYIVANPAYTFFLFWLMYRYGDIKLGADHEKPEFSDVSYFAMIFSAGVAVGLFFYGVSEPLYHRSSHWYAAPGYRSQDEIDNWALMLTAYHWGFAGWSPYVVMGIAAGLGNYRYGLPMTVRSTLYPFFGDYTWGWIGDLIDGFSIVTTVAGICTSLGLGVMQIITGLKRLGLIVAEDDADMTNAYVLTIWIITLIATASVVSGLHVGIQFLSKLGFGIGMVLLVLVFCMEKTYYLLNVIIQMLGTYLQYGVFLLPFWTDAFGGLKDGEGRAPEGAAETWWMDGWTVFYMAWWTAWACFVGMFVARVSRGRTIREVVMYCFIAPLLFSILWFGVFGGAGMRQARQAEELQALGLNLHNDTKFYLTQEIGRNSCYDVPQQDVFYTLNGVNKTFANTLLGVTPVCDDIGDSSWFNVLYSFSYPSASGFGGFGSFLSGLSILAITVYFVTSSDSGSLVVDHLASNGQKEHHWLQRVFWAFTEGAVATALLMAGGTQGLKALQAVSIVFGLPLCALLFLICGSITTMCRHAKENKLSQDLPDPHAHGWTMPIFGGIFNIFEYVASLSCVHQDRVNKGMHLPTPFQFAGFFMALFFPFLYLYQIYSSLDVKNVRSGSKILFTLIYTLIHFGWIILFGLSAINFGFAAFGWVAFLINACILTSLRRNVREKFSIPGNIVGDFFASSFSYPQTLVQMILQLENEKEKDVLT
uniref:Uncharacterized protein n=1 Tax=Corethron hystrix TaxID=216773 RepID=A0A7S1BLI8_9STRA